MATRPTSGPESGGAENRDAGETLAQECWRLSRLEMSDPRRVEECLARRAEAINVIAQRIAKGGAGKSDLGLLVQCVRDGNELLAVWRGEREAIRRQLAQRRAEARFLWAGSTGRGSAGHRSLRG